LVEKLGLIEEEEMFHRLEVCFQVLFSEHESKQFPIGRYICAFNASVEAADRGDSLSYGRSDEAAALHTATYLTSFILISPSVSIAPKLATVVAEETWVSP
jgi:hypothetical protein